MDLKEARAMYCALWREYILAHENRKVEIDAVMLAIQLECTKKDHNGETDWADYQNWLKKDLPSYVSYWTNQIDILSRQVK